MSDVISFRLDPNNPREAQAQEILRAWATKGFSVRYIIIKALIQLGNSEQEKLIPNDLSEMIDKLAKMIDQMEGQTDVGEAKNLNNIELSTSFLSSLKKDVRPGIRISLDDI